MRSPALALSLSLLLASGGAQATAGPGVVLLSDCAPPGALASWRTQLEDWGYAVDVTAQRGCTGSLADLSLAAARQTRRHLASRDTVDDTRIALFGWDAPLVVHAANTVSGGRPQFAAALLAGSRPARLLSRIDSLDAADSRPASEVRDFLQQALDGRTRHSGPRDYPALEPGPDHPPQGRSLFDQLFPNGPPFPFEHLLAALDEALGSGAKPLATLIPDGRSLQREAGGTQPQRSPRAVVAIDRAPTEAGRLLLRDRLFIGYQPRAELLEVISWNPDAARFEFQLVRDYRADHPPQVRYARRPLCLACHQNRAPLFSAAPWDESSDNLQVASSLRDIGSRFYGVTVRRVNNAAVLVDNATDRANRLPQRAALWQQLCGAAGEAHRQCRAAWLGRMIEFKLSRENDFDRDAAGFIEQFTPRAAEAWQRHWPDGLALLNPDVANRDPLRDATILPALDPLAPRPPLDIWHWPDDGAGRAVRELAADLPERLLVQVDRALSARATAARELSAECRSLADHSRVGWRIRRLDCHGDFELRGLFRWRPDGSADSGELDLLGLPGVEPRLRLEARGSGTDFVPVWRDSPWQVRVAPGQLALSLQLDDSRALLKLQRDSAALDAALREMVQTTDGLLDDRRWRPQALLGELLTALGEPQPASAQPLHFSAAAQADALPSIATDALVRPFAEHCGSCHAGTERIPPPFLTGEAAETRRRLEACAPRIRARLAQWRAAAEDRLRTPMPPPMAVGSGFVDSASLKQLLAAAAQIAPSGSSGRYEDLPACRPGG